METSSKPSRKGSGRTAAGEDVGVAMISLGADAIEPAFAAHRQALRVLSEAYRVYIRAEDAADRVCQCDGGERWTAQQVQEQGAAGSKGRDRRMEGEGLS